VFWAFLSAHEFFGLGFHQIHNQRSSAQYTTDLTHNNEEGSRQVMLLRPPALPPTRKGLICDVLSSRRSTPQAKPAATKATAPPATKQAAPAAGAKGKK
jgi:hypothetical protein